MNNQANQDLAVSGQGASALAVLGNQLEKGAGEFRKALPSHITPEKLQRTVLTAVQSTPDLLFADRKSLLNACMKAAQDGLLPDGREAALVVFLTSVKDGQGKWEKVKQVQYMPMVYGLRKKVLQSGSVKDITARVVYRCEVADDMFIYEEGTAATLRHRPKLDMTEEEAADDNIVAAYSMATFDDGTKSYEVMRRFEINKVRQSSQTGAVGRQIQFGQNKGSAIESKGPWVDWFPEQAKKTVIRRHTKTLPMSGDIVDVEAMDDATAALSTTRVLALAEPDAPVTMPTSRQLKQQDEQTAQEQYDANTGEVFDSADDDAAADQEAARLRGDDVDESQDDHEPGWMQHYRTTIVALNAAQNGADVKVVEKDFLRHSAAYDEDKAMQVEAEIRAAKTRLGA